MWRRAHRFLLFYLLAALCGCTSSAQAPAGVTVAEREIAVPSDGEVVLSVTASGPATAWNRNGAEAVAVSVHVDGVYRSDIVLFRGETPFSYETLLGGLRAGAHRVTLMREPSKSSAGAREVRVDAVGARVYPSDDPLYRVMTHAPVLYGRDGSNASDTPLLMYHEQTRVGDAVTIQYTIVFSNEDGGTAPDALMARWGRLTDIEWVYRVTLDASGAVVREEFQDSSHGTSAFRGTRDGSHPFLKDVTRNNLFADLGTSPFRFALVPAEALPDTAREEMMDRHPWTYRVMAEEWEREKQAMTETSADPLSRATSDPRNYLYVEFKNDASPADPASDAKVALQAKLRGEDRWYSSDHDTDSLRIQSRGWRRATIELPPGTTGDRIESLRLVAYPGVRGPSCAPLITGVRTVFLLDAGYEPGPSLLTWNGSLTVEPGGPPSEALPLSASAVR